MPRVKSLSEQEMEKLFKCDVEDRASTQSQIHLAGELSVIDVFQGPSKR